MYVVNNEICFVGLKYYALQWNSDTGLMAYPWIIGHVITLQELPKYWSNVKLMLPDINLAMSSTQRSWIDVFALPGKLNIAVTESDLDRKDRKMSTTF